MVDTVIPILYESTETEFTSNGLGRLSDAISCIVEEERNGAYELTMEYPIHGVHYKDLQNMRVISAVPSDGKERQPFDIYDISRPISGFTVQRRVDVAARSAMQVKHRRQRTISSSLPSLTFLGRNGSARRARPI